MVNLRNDLVFGIYSKDRLNNSISTFHLPITFVINESANKNLISKQLLDTEIFVNKVSSTHLYLSPTRTFPCDLFIVPLQQITGDLLFNKEKIELDDLLNELRLKDATSEFQQLQFAQLKNGCYVADYFINQSSLIYFFNKNEDNFSLLDSCIIENKFYFPKDKEDKQNLIDFITKTTPSLLPHLDTLFYSHSEHNNTKSSKMKP